VTWLSDPQIPRFEVIDAHTAGEPLRLLLNPPPLHGGTVLEKRRYMRDHLDHVRTALMFEPRGHADMYGAILTEPETEDGDFGVLFLHNEGYSTMCGHGVIAIATILIEAQMWHPPADGLLRLDTPAGRVTAEPEVVEGRVRAVSFENVPSFLAADRAPVKLSDGSQITATLAYGGAFYVYVDAEEAGVTLDPSGARWMIEKGMEIKRAAMEQLDIRHPGSEDLSFLYGTIFVGPPHDATSHSRNVCIFAEGEVDRSPTGTGVSGRAAIHYARGDIKLNQPIVIESVLGTTFEVEAIREVDYLGHSAIIPRVRGSAFVTGRSEFILDPRDPLQHGFIIR
jgi:proline racemase